MQTLAFSSALVFGVAYAADEATTSKVADPVQLNPVIVIGSPTATAVESATKTEAPVVEVPQSVSVITRESLDEQNVQSLNQALRFVPGVQSEQYGSDNVYDFFQIRGFSANLNGVFRDGLQLLSSGNSFAAFRPEPYGVERLELLRGPASALYGSANPGGLVNYVSKQPTATPLREVQLEYGNYDWREGKIDFSGPIASAPGVQYRLTGLYRDSGTQVDFEQNNRQFIAPAVSWQLSSDTKLTLLSQYQKDEAGHLQFLPADGTLLPNPNGRIPLNRNDGEPAYNGFDREQWSAGWLVEHRFSSAWSGKQQLRYDHLDTSFRDVFGLAFDPADGSQRTLTRATFSSADTARAVSMDSNLTAQLGSGRLQHTLLFGVDYQHIDYDSAQGFGDAPSIDIYTPTYGAAITPATIVSEAGTRREQVGLYAQEQARLDERWLLLVSGRQDFVDARVRDRLADSVTTQSDSKLTGRAGVSYHFDTGLVPYVSYATSFLPVLGIDSAGNSYQPETGKQWEGGAKFEAESLKSLFTLAAFHIDRDNVLTPSADPNDPFGQVQTGAVRSQGAELSVEAKPLPGLHLVGAYTYQDVEVTRSNAGNQGLRPVATAEQLASLHARYALHEGALAGVGFSGAVRHQGSSYGDDLNTLKVPAFTLFDAGVDYLWQGIRFSLYAQNLADKEHFAACQNGSCFYGIARTVTGSVGYRW